MKCIKYLHVGKLASQQSSAKGGRQKLKEKSIREAQSAKHSERIALASIRGRRKRSTVPRAATKSENGQSGSYKNGPGM